MIGAVGLVTGVRVGFIIKPKDVLSPSVKYEVRKGNDGLKHDSGGDEGGTPKKAEGPGNHDGNFAGKINADNIPNMSRQEILESLPLDWNYTEHSGFVHIRDANGNIRMKIDPPDKVTKYDHVHLFDESGNPIDVNLNVVDRKSPNAHIPYKK